MWPFTKQPKEKIRDCHDIYADGQRLLRDIQRAKLDADIVQRGIGEAVSGNDLIALQTCLVHMNALRDLCDTKYRKILDLQDEMNAKASPMGR